MANKIILILIATFLQQILFAQTTFIVEANYTGKPIVEMTLNGKTTWVLLDTGSDITILNLDLKNKYEFETKIKSDKKMKVQGFGSADNQLLEVFNAEIEFGNTVLNNRLFAFDISSISASIKDRTGKEIGAIVGTDLMRKYGFILDLKNGTARMPQKLNKKQARKKANSMIATGY